MSGFSAKILSRACFLLVLNSLVKFSMVRKTTASSREIITNNAEVRVSHRGRGWLTCSGSLPKCHSWCAGASRPTGGRRARCERLPEIGRSQENWSPFLAWPSASSEPARAPDRGFRGRGCSKPIGPTAKRKDEIPAGAY